MRDRPHGGEADGAVGTAHDGNAGPGLVEDLEESRIFSGEMARAVDSDLAERSVLVKRVVAHEGDGAGAEASDGRVMRDRGLQGRDLEQRPDLTNHAEWYCTHGRAVLVGIRTQAFQEFCAGVDLLEQGLEAARVALTPAAASELGHVGVRELELGVGGVVRDEDAGVGRGHLGVVGVETGVILMRRMLDVALECETLSANVVVARKLDVLGSHAVRIAHSDAEEKVVVSEAHVADLSLS